MFPPIAQLPVVANTTGAPLPVDETSRTREPAAYSTTVSSCHGAPATPLTTGVTEIGFADLEGVRVWSDWYRGPAGQVLRDDEERFMDVARRVVIVTEVRALGNGR